MDFYLTLFAYLVQSKEHWTKYNDYIDFDFLKGNYPDLYKLCITIERGYEDYSFERFHSESFLLLFSKLYPGNISQTLRTLCEKIFSIQVPETLLHETIRGIRLQERAAALASAALAVSDGKEQPETLTAVIEDYLRDNALLASQSTDERGSEFVTDDLETIVHNQNTKLGLRWRLNTLNRYLGSLRKGNFGFVFARPETGKTTFLASELTCMAEQPGDGNIIWFNNEEPGEEVMTRIYQATFGITYDELISDVPKDRSLYQERTRGRIKLVDNVGCTAREAERIITQNPAALVVFDQIDKLRGFTGDRDDLTLASIYKWARGIAKTYCPVIGICQAGATGDGKKWLTMNDVDNSKTGKQAEADWILGIGKTYDSGLEALRYLHLSKNKLRGDTDRDPSMRHGKWEVKIAPEKARYEDF
jgi:hypothetical protein